MQTDEYDKLTEHEKRLARARFFLKDAVDCAKRAGADTVKVDVRHLEELLRERAAEEETFKHMQGVGDSWKMLAIVDRMAEMGDLRKVGQSGYIAGQHEIYEVQP